MVNLQEIKEKAIKGSLWSILEKFSLQIIQFVVSVILARLLEPKDYGLIAITLIFTSISAAITDGGFEKTIIQKRNLTPIQINTIFYISVGLGIILSSLVFFSASVISEFFKEAELIHILKFVSLGIFLNALGQIQSTLLRKDLNFKKLSSIQVFSSFASGISGIWMAYMGYGIWSLVFSMLLSQLITTSCYWVNSKWYPKLMFSFYSIKSVMPFGLNVLFSSILFFFAQQFNSLVVGKFHSKADLGLFNRGSKFPELATGVIEAVILKMSFPLFSKLQDDENELQKLLEKTVKLIAFVSFPILTLLFLVANEITIILFTTKWLGSVIFLKCFCFIKVLNPFVAVYREIILAKGHATLLTKILVFTTIVEVGLILSLIQFGLLFVVVGSLISVIIQFVTYAYILSIKLDVKWQNNIKWILPYFLISIFTALIILASEVLFATFQYSTILTLVTKLILGVFLFLVTYYFFNVEGTQYIKIFNTLLRKRISNIFIKNQLLFKR